MNGVLMCVTFIMVFLMAIQNQNVIHGHKIAAMLTSYLIAATQVTTTLLIVDTGFSSIPWVGTGGAFGVLFGIILFRKFFRRDV